MEVKRFMNLTKRSWTTKSDCENPKANPAATAAGFFYNAHNTFFQIIG